MRQKKIKIILASALILLFVLVLSINSIASPPPDAGCDPADPTCPIDGGVSARVAIGIGLGYKKYIKNK